LYPHTYENVPTRLGLTTPLLRVCSNRPHGWTDHATDARLDGPSKAELLVRFAVVVFVTRSN